MHKQIQSSALIVIYSLARWRLRRILKLIFELNLYHMKKYSFALIFFLATLQSFAQCPATTSQIDLDINNVRARLLVGGDLWWDPVGQTPYYEVPIGSNKISIYCGSIWIGGIDKLGQIKVAAQTYRQQSSNDFWGGPISRNSNYGTAGGISVTRCQDFDRFWSVSRAEVLNFIQGGAPTAAIQQWPGNGNVSNGELPFLAPYFDANNDGIYNYQDGDYPYFNFSGTYPVDPGTGLTVCNDYLFGDKSIWWVFNDVGNVKTETGSAPIGLEVRAQAFAYSSSDPDLNNTTFYNYQVINRSSDSLTQTYFGVWCDPDLGNAADDYVGCDVGLGLGYVYNGDPNDDGGQGYGLNPPAVGIDFFQGPLADAGDGIDNDKDGTFDEPGEQIIMSNFLYYKNTNNIPDGNPATTDDYYEYLSGSWLDGLPITYGGNGRGGATPCNFMFPGNTDPNFSISWTMVTANIQPDDMRWLQSAGSFTLAPGAVNYITTGVVWAKDTSGGPLASVQLLKSASQKIQTLFDDCFTTTSLTEFENSISVQTNPNPFYAECKLSAPELKGKTVEVIIYDINGKIIEKNMISNCNGEYVLGNNYKSGIYLLHLTSGNKSHVGKIIKM
jgi:hypothetical protein